MAVHRLDLAWRSHVGRVRAHNQDWVHSDGGLGIVALADGMGGHRAGEVASRLAVDAAFDALVSTQRDAASDDLESLLRIGRAVEKANDTLINAGIERPELAGMGTTLVVAIFRDRHIYYAHVGDSRLYRVRFGRIRRLTRDHSLIQHMIDDGVFMDRATARAAGIGDNVLMRSLGLQRQTEVDVGNCQLEAGDIYLLSSDGLHGLVSDNEIGRILREPEDDLDAKADALLDAAMAAGGNDNISVVLARPRLD